MRKLLIAVGAAGVLLAGVVPAAVAAPSRQSQAAGKGECGLPAKRPLWIDFGDGSVPFWDLFAQPGLVSAAANFVYPPRIRALGGSTVYFDLNFHRRMGSPGKPKPLSDVVESANRLFYYASASTGCTHPWIALNELFGANLPTPWSATNTVYRANVLAFIKILSAHGAHVFLLVNNKPYAADEAGDWWREVAKYSDFVREVYFPAPSIFAKGPVLGSRTLRQGFRKGVLDLTSIGIPVSKVGLFLGFQTERGNGGREGLARLKWFRTIKWQAFAARQVAAELKVPSIWSWGWGEWGGQSVDPDKPAAACVYLWARNPKLCNGPKAAGAGFNASRTEGQINLPSGVQCVVGDERMPSRAISQLVPLTGDRQAAYSALFARMVERLYTPVTAAQVRVLEREVIATYFGGSAASYRAALKRAGVGRAVARGILEDELHQAAIESRTRAAAPGAGAISSYYQRYASLPARLVSAKPAPWWLGGLKKGLAISSVAPARVFRLPAGRWRNVQTPFGEFRVRPAGSSSPLATFPLSTARPAVRAAIQRDAKSNAYRRWTTAKQRAALKRTACRRDSLPQIGALDLSSYLPFLAL